LREGRQRESRLRAKELFWWLTGKKYKLGRVVERGEEMVSSCKLKGSLWGGLMTVVRGEGAQKRELGSKKSKPLLEFTEKKEK
jgi:hypothetical protein